VMTSPKRVNSTTSTDLMTSGWRLLVVRRLPLYRKRAMSMRKNTELGLNGVPNYGNDGGDTMKPAFALHRIPVGVRGGGSHARGRHVWLGRLTLTRSRLLLAAQSRLCRDWTM
jgi:hypothetical protein